MTGPVRIALVGCGRISRNHFEAIGKIEELQLVAVSDIVESRAREAGEREDVPWFASYTKMLEHAPCDIVAVCTPSGLHPQHGMLAARAGKHVVCEKPMAITLTSADELAGVRRRRGAAVRCEAESPQSAGAAAEAGD